MSVGGRRQNSSACARQGNAGRPSGRWRHMGQCACMRGRPARTKEQVVVAIPPSAPPALPAGRRTVVLTSALADDSRRMSRRETTSPCFPMAPGRSTQADRDDRPCTKIRRARVLHPEVGHHRRAVLGRTHARLRTRRGRAAARRLVRHPRDRFVVPAQPAQSRGARPGVQSVSGCGVGSVPFRATIASCSSSILPTGMTGGIGIGDEWQGGISQEAPARLGATRA